jgi:DtxR family Mn-dependent transcriptional regulator
MKKSREMEEYLELLYRFKEEKRESRVKEISSRLRVSPASVSEMLRKLSKKGLIRKYEKYGKIELTEMGEAEGKKLLRKHRTIERFLAMLGLGRKKLHEEACVLEHAVSDEVEQVLDKAVKNGKLAGNARKLSEMRPGESGKILFIEGGAIVCARLQEMGLTPGTRIIVRHTSTRHGPVEICVRSSCLALGRGISEKILVEVEE